MSSQAPDPRETSDLLFRRARFLRFKSGEESKGEGSAALLPPKQQLAAASKFGKLFAAPGPFLACLDLSAIEVLDQVSNQERLKEVDQFPFIRVPLPSTPTHLALSADELTLCVALSVLNKPHLYFFDVRAFATGGNGNIAPFTEVSGSTPPGTVITELAFNPVMASMISVVFSNGSLALFMLDGTKAPDCATLPPAENITCVSWSPKGKQLVAGRKNGSLTQYKPDLKEAKTMQGPSPSLEAVSVLWISTYLFMVAYRNKAEEPHRAGLYLVQGSKAGPTTYVNYDDVCYSTGEKNSPYYSMSHLPDWGLILCASSNGIEIAALGATDPERSQWVQWILQDAGRAELPLDPKTREERYPVGSVLALSSQRQLEFEDQKFYPFPMPMAFFMTEDGLLCSFYVINRAPDAKKVTNSPVSLPTEGIRTGTVVVPAAVQKPQKPAGAMPPPPAYAHSSPAPVTPFAKPPVVTPTPSPFSGLAASTPLAAPPKFSQPSNAPPPASIFGASAVVPSKSTPKESGGTDTGVAAISSAKGKTADVPAPVTKGHARPPEPELTEESSAETEAMCEAVIKQQFKIFTKQLQDFKAQKVENFSRRIGTDDDKASLKRSIEDLDQFCSDLWEITISQNNEIRHLQNSTLEANDWVEEAKARQARNRQPQYQRTLNNRPLDPLSRKLLSGVQSRFFYLEQQLQEANRKFDLQWKNRVRKTKGHRGIEVPSREMIYHTLVTNRRIMESQKNLLHKLEAQMNRLRLTSGVIQDEATLLLTLRLKEGHSTDKDQSKITDELSNLTESFLESTKLEESMAKEREKEKTFNSAYPIKTSFSPEKVSALRRLLEARGTTKVTPVKKESPTGVTSLLEKLGQVEKKFNKAKEQAQLKKPDLSSASTGAPKTSSSASSSFSFGSSSLTITPVPSAKPDKSVNASSGVQIRLSSPKPTSSGLGGLTGGSSPAASTSTFSGFGSASNAKPAPVQGSNFGGSKPATGGLFGSNATPSFCAVPSFEKPFAAVASVATTISSGITSSVVTASTPGSAFGVTTTTAAGTKPLFGTGVSATSPFGQNVLTSTSAFGQLGAKTTSTSASVANNTGSIFGSASVSATTKISAVSSVNITTPSTTAATATSASTSTFAKSLPTTTTTTTVTTTTSILTSTTAAAAAAAPPPPPLGVTTSSIFGGASSTLKSNSFFGTPVATGTTTSVFGTTAKSTTAVSSTGGSSVTSTTSSTVGSENASTSASTSTTSAFGGSSKPNTTKSNVSSVFSGSVAFSSAGATTASTSSSTPPSFGAFRTSATKSATSAATPVFAASTTVTTIVTSSATTGVFSSTTPVLGSSTGASTSTTTTSAISESGKPVTTAASVFGGNALSPSTATGSLFGGTKVSASVTSSSSPAFGTPVTSTTSIFGAGANSSTASTSIFGGGSTGASTSLFGAGTTSTTTDKNVTPSMLRTPPKTTASSSTPLFGAPASTTTPIFGGSSSTVASTAAPIFGGSSSTKVASTAAPIFGSSSTTTATTTASIFGGSSSTTASTTAPIFGGSSSTKVASTAAPIFGSSSTTTATTTASIFGGSSSTTASTTAPIFGGSLTTVASTAASIFSGSSSTTAAGGGSVFGGSSVFGASPTTTTASSIFGGSAASSTTSSTSLFSSPGVASTTSTSTFGAGGSSSSSTFGSTSVFGGLSLGTATTTTTSSNAPQSSPFSFTPSSQGASTSSLFGGTAKPTGFGSGSVFGTSATAAVTSSSTGFSSSGSTSSVLASGFSNSSGGFGSPGPSSPSTQGTFGAAPAFGTKPAFGSPPTFGGAPAFGSAPVFGGGGSPAMGATSSGFATAAANVPTFGSLAVGSGGAGAAATSSPTFGSMAQQTSTGFEALAQQQGGLFGGGQGTATFGQQSGTSSSFGGFGSPSSSGSVFGGSGSSGIPQTSPSFTSWR